MSAALPLPAAPSASGSGAAPRIALIGAFPFPVPQGSQVLVEQQARALAAAGAVPTFLCYGSGQDRRAGALDIVRIPRALSPRRMRAGPSFAKPLADAALVGAYLSAHRRRHFDLALAHNAEAALVGLAARPLIRVPVIYVAHTLLGEELASYAAPRWTPGLNRLGRALDAFLARACDGAIVLCAEAERRLRAHARGPVECIPPGLACDPPPSRVEVERACARHGLAPGGFAVYAGNLDRYQDLDLLARAARRVPQIPVLVVSHSPAAAGLDALRQIRAEDAGEARALTHAAGLALLPRRRPGGFPIKLLNYMEAGLPIVAYALIAEGLEHERSAWLLPRGAGAAELSDAIRHLFGDRALAARLGRGAREVLEARHGWPAIAERTLRFAAALRRRPTGEDRATAR